MEELLVIIIQFLIEVVGQALIQVPFDCGYRRHEKPESNVGVTAFLFLLVGGLVGWMSVELVPGTLIHIPALRVANLVATPFVGGLIGYHIAKWQYETRNPDIVPKYHFWYAFFFTLALAAVRLAYGKH